MTFQKEEAAVNICRPIGVFAREGFSMLPERLLVVMNGFENCVFCTSKLQGTILHILSGETQAS